MGTSLDEPLLFAPTADQFHSLFPFHFVMGKDCRLIQVNLCQICSSRGPAECVRYVLGVLWQAARVFATMMTYYWAGEAWGYQVAVLTKEVMKNVGQGMERQGMDRVWTGCAKGMDWVSIMGPTFALVEFLLHRYGANLANKPTPSIIEGFDSPFFHLDGVEAAQDVWMVQDKQRV